MTLDGLRVNHGGLDLAAQDLHRAVQQIDERLDRLEGELSPLRSDWTGRAQEAYERAKRTWDGAIQEMVHLLADTGRTVAASNEDYRAADQRGAAAFDL